MWAALRAGYMPKTRPVRRETPKVMARICQEMKGLKGVMRQMRKEMCRSLCESLCISYDEDEPR